MFDALPTDDRHQQITTYLGSVFGENLHVKPVVTAPGHMALRRVGLAEHPAGSPLGHAEPLANMGDAATTTGSA